MQRYAKHHPVGPAMAVEDPGFARIANIFFGKHFCLKLHKNEKELELPGSATEL